MEVYCRGTARIRHSATGDVYRSKAMNSTGMRSVATNARWDRKFSTRRWSIPELEKLTWSLWEYPIGIET